MRALLVLATSFIAMLAAGTAQAARPFVTDDARTVDPGGCQVETVLKQQQKYREREFWFLPACNPWGRAELTLGGIWIDSAQPGDSRTLIAQVKTLLKPLETDGVGFAATIGLGHIRPFESSRATNPYVNLIGSLSRWNDRVVFHANLGGVRDRLAERSRGTWGLGAEVLVAAPRLYAIIESYGQSGDKPTFHTGLRYWVIPNRLQIDATAGRMHSAPPERHFSTIGLRFLW